MTRLRPVRRRLTLMPLTLLEPRRIYRQIAEQIIAMIASGELAPNARLPSERDLAHRLGVSRPPVREALIALEVEGLVDVRMGSGVYVRQEAASRASTWRARKAGEIGPFELLAARRMVESDHRRGSCEERDPRTARGNPGNR